MSTLSQNTYKLASFTSLAGTPIADTVANSKNTFDAQLATTYSSTAATCFVGLDFGPFLKAGIDRIRFFGNRAWKNVASYILGAKLTASNDNTLWTTLYTIDSTVHTGWNIWRPSTPLTATYRYVRF